MSQQQKDSPASGLQSAANAASSIAAAVKTGKRIAGLAKGAAGPYGWAMLAWDHRKIIGKVIAAVLCLPILFIAMLPALIFGTKGDPIEDTGTEGLVMNDNSIIMENIVEVNQELDGILQDSLASTIESIQDDFAASTAEFYELDNPFTGATVINALRIISQYCASLDTDTTDMSLSNLAAQVKKHKDQLFTYTRELKLEQRMVTRTAIDETTGQEYEYEELDYVYVAYYTVLFCGEQYFQEHVFELEEEQISLSHDYYENLLLLLQDFDFVDPDIAALIDQFPYSGFAGEFASPFHDRDWRNCVSSEIGWRTDPLTKARDYHRGIDLEATIGTPIYACRGGVVMVASPWVNSYGNYVMINHGDGMVTLYAHCDTLNVTVGQEVEQGDLIATVGDTGRVTGPHLHLEVIVDGEVQNPRSFLP